jgi:hypothetical protein
VRRFVPIDLSMWDVSYLYIYFLWGFFCINSDKCYHKGGRWVKNIIINFKIYWLM